MDACWSCHKPNTDGAEFCAHCTDTNGFPPPLRFGSLKVVSRLGEGAFGSVYRALDPYLKREVAVKKLLPFAGGTDALMQELQTLAGVCHPNVVTIYHSDPSKRYFSMEFVSGGTLQEALASDSQWFRTHFDAFATQLCEGLRSVHEKQICHRDIKPQNIMLTEARSPKLSDFGLARVVRTGALAHTKAGTPHYIAPEIWNGEDYDLDVDVYSLGVLFYQIWTGSFPFDASTLNGLILKALAGKFVAAKELNADVPDRIDGLISQMLAPHAQRIQEIGFVLTELQRGSGLQTFKRTDIDGFQQEIASIYGFRNARRSPLLIIGHLLTNASGLVGGLLATDATYGRQRTLYYFPRTFAWICALYSALNCRIRATVWTKFPGICPYCNAMSCVCDPSLPRRSPEVNERILFEAQARGLQEAGAPLAFAEYRQMFRRIYGERNTATGLEECCMHFIREIIEALDAILGLKSLRELNEVMVLHLELADIVAWFFAVVDRYGENFDFEGEFWRTFPGRCYRCKMPSCRCEGVDTELRLAAWREFEEA